MSLLAESLDRGELVFTEAHWRNLIGELFDELREDGLIDGPSVAEHIPCDLCDQPGHPAFVHFDQSSNSYLVTCLVAGSVKRTTCEVEVWGFRPEALLTMIRRAAGIETRTAKHRISEDLVPVGTGNLGQTTYGVYVLIGAENPTTFNEFLRRNRAGFGTKPSIVLCAHKPQVLPEDVGVHSVVPIRDILFYSAGAFRFRTKLLRQALKLSRSGKKAAPVLEATVSAFLRYLEDHDTLPQGRENLREVFEEYGPKDMSPPRRSTLFKAKQLINEGSAQSPKSSI